MDGRWQALGYGRVASGESRSLTDTRGSLTRPTKCWITVLLKVRREFSVFGCLRGRKGGKREGEEGGRKEGEEEGERRSKEGGGR